MTNSDTYIKINGTKVQIIIKKNHTELGGNVRCGSRA